MIVSPKLEPYRMQIGQLASVKGEPYGMFTDVPGPCGAPLVMFADDGRDSKTGWEHVSVSTRKRIPNWQEMCFVKSLFWLPEDCVVQFHPPASRCINNLSTVLHLWRAIGKEFPTPPDILVGYKELGELKL